MTVMIGSAFYVGTFDHPAKSAMLGTDLSERAAFDAVARYRSFRRAR